MMLNGHLVEIMPVSFSATIIDYLSFDGIVFHIFFISFYFTCPLCSSCLNLFYLIYIF